MMIKNLTLAPSAFGFLYDECRACYYSDVHGLRKRPRLPFPSIFSTIDRAMKQHLSAPGTRQNSYETGGTAVLAQGNSASGVLFRGNNTNSKDVFTVDNNGNVHAHSFTADLSSGASSITAASNVEHTGEANLVNGAAIVRLEPSFTATMGQGTYMVFITPQGQTQGSLYVTQKGPGSFMVREN